jgi:transcriptional regulator with XRE-family HTH domain
MNTQINERILLLLEKNKLTQKELSIQVGVTEAAMSRYISGDREPKLNVVSNMATVLQTTTDYLLGRDNTDCLETEFGKVKMFVARNSSNMTLKQKKALIEALLSDDD